MLKEWLFILLAKISGLFLFFSDGTTLNVVPSPVVTVNQRVTLQCISNNRLGNTNTVYFHIQLDSSQNCTLVMTPFDSSCKVRKVENSCEVSYTFYGFCPSDIEYNLEFTVTMHWNGAVVFCQDVYSQSNRILFIVTGAVMIEFYMKYLILHFMSLYSKICLYCSIMYELNWFRINVK